MTGNGDGTGFLCCPEMFQYVGVVPAFVGFHETAGACPMGAGKYDNPASVFQSVQERPEFFSGHFFNPQERTTARLDSRMSPVSS